MKQLMNVVAISKRSNNKHFMPLLA